MFRTKVLLTLHRFSSICPKLVQMLYQLSKWGLSNDFMLMFISQHALQLEKCGMW